MATYGLPTARNHGDVIRGALFGAVLGFGAVIGVLLAMPRGRKREDVLFGTWVGFAALMALVLGGVVLFSLSSVSDTSTTAPATVVGEPPAVFEQAVVMRTAPEVMTAVRTIHPDYCAQPPDDVTDSGNRRSFRYNLTGPQQQPDGRWFVNCMAATTVWWDGVPLTVVQHRCKAINPDSLTVTDVETGDTLTKDERANTSTFGRSCLV